MSDGGSQILPFYIICDESLSMSEYLDGVNDSLKGLHKTISQDPVVCDKAQISVITFSDQAETLVELTRPDELVAMPGCSAKGGTSYGAAFRALRDAIERDIQRLKSHGFRVLRPAAFFITDGAPTDGDGWRSVHADLVSLSNPYRPNILSFGVGSADRGVILDIATGSTKLGIPKFAFLADEGISPGPALKEIIGKLAGTIVSSSRAESPQLVPPTDIQGVTNIAAIELDELT